MKRFMDKKITIEEAAAMLGISKIMMREIISNVPANVGFCKYNKSRRTFYINKQNFIDYFNL